MIHPTAIVHCGAHLGSQVTVGPHAIIDGSAQIGDGCTVQAHAVIGKSVVIGKKNVIGYGAIIGSDPQDVSFDPGISSAVHIGDGNTIREYCTIHRGGTEGSATIVADNCFLMAGAHLGHNVRLGNNVVIADNSLLGGYVSVDDDAFIGSGCGFHQYVRVGRLSLCQPGGAFSKDVPPCTVGAELNGVAGVNVVGLRQAGLLEDHRAEIEQAFSLLFCSGKNVTQALAAARERPWRSEAQAFFDFVAGAKKRGLCDFIDTRKGTPSWRSYREDPAVL